MKLPIRDDVTRLTGPLLVEQICTSLMAIVSTVMAARLGQDSVSAIAMVESISAVIGAIFSALGIGATVVVAQLLGRGDPLTATRATFQSMLSAVVIAASIACTLIVLRTPVLLFVFPSVHAAVMDHMLAYLAVSAVAYPLTALNAVASGALRGAGDSAATMKVNILTNIVHLLLSYGLIYGVAAPFGPPGQWIPAFGLVGAAMATVLSRLTGSIYLVAYAVLKGDALPPRGMGHYRFDLKLNKAIFAVGLPMGMESMMFSGGKLVVQIFIAGLGTAAIAANFIAFSVSSFINIPGAALAVALTTLVGRDVGREDYAAARETMWHVLRVAWVTMGIIGILVFPLAPWAVGQYTQDPAAIELGVTLVRMNCFFLLCYPTTFILPYGFKGAGDARYTVWTTFIGMLVFRLLLGYVLGIGLGFGIVGVWCGVIADWFVRSAMYVIRLRGDKWHGRGVVINGTRT